MEEKRITYHEGADGMLYPNLELPQEQEISMTQIGKTRGTDTTHCIVWEDWQRR